jgi:hypothetical protein
MGGQEALPTAIVRALHSKCGTPRGKENGLIHHRFCVENVALG